jgi:hypothetical protein
MWVEMSIESTSHDIDSLTHRKRMGGEHDEKLLLIASTPDMWVETEEQPIHVHKVANLRKPSAVRVSILVSCSCRKAIPIEVRR